MSILDVLDGPSPYARFMFELGQRVKEASDAVPAYNLSGALYLSSNGWLMLAVPNALVRGFFSAMAEPGVELPPSGPDGKLNGHCTVMKPAELAMIGGADKITERGKQFHYSIGRWVEVENPEGWPEVSKVWMLRVHSPELQALRRSYGLSGLPNDGKHDFHITCAVRKRGVLGRNDTSKTDSGVPQTRVREDTDAQQLARDD